MEKIYQILILEDDEILAESIKDYLETKMMKVSLASTIAKASTLIRNQKFDLFLFDYSLANDKYSDELVERIKSSKVDNLNYKTPIVILSGTLDVEAVMVLKGKINKALVKPVEKNELFEEIMDLLNP